MSIKIRLHEALSSLGLKITEASEKTGIPYRSLQNYLRGEREPSAEALRALNARLSISIDWLLTGEGQMLKTPSAPTTWTPRGKAVLDVFEDLSEEDQREVQRHAEEKKRLRDLEKKVDDMSATLRAPQKSA